MIMTSVLGIALLTFALSGTAVAFVPIGGGPSTHVSITATALLQKVTETCRVVAEAAGHEFKPTGSSPDELVQACLGPRATGEVSGAKFHSALQDIYTQNGLVDRDFVSRSEKDRNQTPCSPPLQLGELCAGTYSYYGGTSTATVTGSSWETQSHTSTSYGQIFLWITWQISTLPPAATVPVEHVLIPSSPTS
ncbi:hypothetical protein F7725_005326 [Dissostichus mawsoni]|uniref:Uncharacterized protein n=1 Tax=Dissostichus mawsoni TaxID=36200 RepID=A0A7J5YSR7_DISMA|nr:hypothetical protein F7725_005326 [Dissostichus mawsoni]